jgi:hypothetical protein
MGTELTIQEAETLKELEHVIKDGLYTYFEVGAALMKIRDLELYRATHTTFESYCRDTFQISRAQAYRLIDSYNVQSTIDKAQAKDFIEQAKSLQLETKNEEEKEEILNDLRRSTLQKPQNESQIRPLTKLPPEKQAKAWMKAVETAPEGKITAKHVQQVVNTMTGKATVKGKKDKQPGEAVDAFQLAEMSINQLKQIANHDPQKAAALNYVEEWIENNINRKPEEEISARGHWEYVVNQIKKLNEYIYENCCDSFTLEEDIYQELCFNSSHTAYLIMHGKQLYKKYKEGGTTFSVAKRRDLEIENWLNRRRLSE